MKSILALVLLLMCAEVLADWTTNSSISMVNVTPNVKTEDMSGYLHAFYTADGTNHIMLGYNGIKAQAWDINLTNNASHVLTLSNSTSAVNQPLIACILTYSNTFLLQAGDSTFSEWWEYNPVTGAYAKIFTNTDAQASSVCRAPDGVIFMGTYGTVKVDAWNPADNTFWSYGPADTNLVGVGNYGYYIAADTNSVYCVVRGGDPDWYLSIINRATTNKMLVFTNGPTTDVTVLDGISGGVYCRAVTNSVITYWQLTNGALVSMTSGEYSAIPKFDPDEEPGVDRDMYNWDTTKGYDFDISGSPYSVDDSIPTATTRWKLTNDVAWTITTETNDWLPQAAAFDMVQPWSGGNLLWYSHGYGPVGTFTPGGSATIIGAYKSQSTRDLLQVSDTEAYLAGYHMNTLRWDPSESWTLTPSSDLTNTAVNPHRVDETGGKYHSMLARGVNGNIFNASRWERNGVGGSLGVYTPSNGVLDTIRLNDADETPTDLKPAIGATKIVWSSYGSGLIRVYDVATFAEDTNYTVSVGMIQKCVEYESGKMFGISGSNICAWSVTTGALIYSNSLPAAPYNITSATTDYERITLGPDNYVWQVADGNLYRINPATGTYVNVVSTTNDYKIMFDGGDAYLYGGTAIYELNDLLLSTSVLRVGNLLSAPK